MGALSGCMHLRKVNLGSMTSVPTAAFSTCTSLEEIDLSKVTVINPMAFYGCENLRNVTFGEGLVLMDAMAFENTALVEFTAPSGLMLIGEQALCNCANLKKIIFPEDSKCGIEPFAFGRDMSLEEILIESDQVALTTDSLSIGSLELGTAHLKLTIPKGYSLNGDAYDDYTVYDITHIGEKPYPYENILGVLVCLVVLFGIFKMFRRV